MKTKYRIIEYVYGDKSTFVPQFRRWWWPFWSSYYIRENGQFGEYWVELVEYDVITDAVAHIKSERKSFSYQTVNKVIHEVV